MDEYRIRAVTHNDFPFLAEVIIRAEKGNSGILSLATLFNLDENGVRNLIIDMLNEETEGCEFSPSSFLLVDYQDKPVAAVGSWIEGFNGNLPSGIIKSNLLNYILGKESILSLKVKSNIIADIQIEREKLTLQCEYVYVARAHRGKGITLKLMNAVLARGFALYPKLSKVQAQVYSSNAMAIKVFGELGFRKIKVYRSDNKEIFNYLPNNEKLLIEKNLRYHGKD